MIRFAIGGAMLVLMCGHVLVWRRRDNVLGYVAVGSYLATFAIPLFGTSFLAGYETEVVEAYAAVLVLGAPAYLGGLAYGAFVGRRSLGRVAFTFARPSSDADVALVGRRARLLAGVGLVGLVGAYALLGYAPLFEADSQSAKYGVGIYASGFARGRVVYLFALALAAAVLPVMLALFQRQRRWLDLALAVALGLGLLLSLNRGLTFLGPVTFLAAWAVQRRLKAWMIVAGVAGTFLAAIVFNQLTLPSHQGSPSFATMATISAPDLLDQLNFMEGFEEVGRPYNSGSTILAGLNPGGGEDGSSYALRIATGIQDLGQLASGGLRLPSPVWGYSAFGLGGAVMWPFISGFFAGWGITKLKRMVAPAMGRPGQALTLVLAVAVYNGTFGLLEQFYFTSTAGFVLLAVAVYLGVNVRLRLATPARIRVDELEQLGLGPKEDGDKEDGDKEGEADAKGEGDGAVAGQAQPRAPGPFEAVVPVAPPEPDPGPFPTLGRPPSGSPPR